jgi:hypothetical protein
MSPKWKIDGVRRSRWAVIRQTNRRLDDTTIVTWDYWLSRFGSWYKSRRNFILRLTAEDGSPVEAEILFRPLDEPDDVENLLSLELTGAWFNELKELTSKSIWDMMDARVGRYPPADAIAEPAWSGIWGDSNPSDTDHWMYRLFVDERPLICATCRRPDGGPVVYTPREVDGVAKPPVCPLCGAEEQLGIPQTSLYEQPSGLSPEAENLPHLERGYYSKKCIGKDPIWIKVFIEGEWGYSLDGKPVYSVWKDQKFLPYNDQGAIIPDYEAHRSYPLICGCDPTGNNQAFAINQWMPDGRFFTYDELYQESTDSQTFLKDVISPFIFSRYNGFPKNRIHIIIDPASKRSDSVPSNFKKEAQTLGFNNIYKAFANNWDARFGAVNRLLLMGLYRMNRRCKLLHKGFLGDYQWERKHVSGKDIYKDEPVKNKVANLHDALQYAAMGPSREDKMTIYHHPLRDHGGAIHLGSHL